jgi:hypothetical protein
MSHQFFNLIMSFINETVIIRVMSNSFSFIASFARVVSTYISGTFRKENASCKGNFNWVQHYYMVVLPCFGYTEALSKFSVHTSESRFAEVTLTA